MAQIHLARDELPKHPALDFKARATELRLQTTTGISGDNAKCRELTQSPACFGGHPANHSSTNVLSPERVCKHTWQRAETP